MLQLLGDMQVGCNPGDGVYNSALLSIESHLRGHNMTMKDFPDMPIPDRRSEEQLPSRLIQTELAYDVSKLRSHVGQCVNNFTIEQKAAFDRIMEAVNQPQRKVGLADFGDHCIQCSATSLLVITKWHVHAIVLCGKLANISEMHTWPYCTMQLVGKVT